MDALSDVQALSFRVVFCLSIEGDLHISLGSSTSTESERKINSMPFSLDANINSRHASSSGFTSVVTHPIVECV